MCAEWYWIIWALKILVVRCRSGVIRDHNVWVDHDPCIENPTVIQTVFMPFSFGSLLGIAVEVQWRQSTPPTGRPPAYKVVQMRAAKTSLVGVPGKGHRFFKCFLCAQFRAAASAVFCVLNSRMRPNIIQWHCWLILVEPLHCFHALPNQYVLYNDNEIGAWHVPVSVAGERFSYWDYTTYCMLGSIKCSAILWATENVKYY